MSIVLLITLDSIAESVRSVKFQSVNASAVLITASHRIITQLLRFKLGNGSTIRPIPNKMIDPTPMLTSVTVSG